MDYSNLFLTNESIENVFKTKQKPIKSIGRGFASLVKPGAENVALQECKKCDYKSATYNNMYQHNRVKHTDIRHKCTECDFTHGYPTKVRTHHRQVHLGLPRSIKQPVCHKNDCEKFGKLDCKELLHLRIFCGQCDFSAKRTDALKIHTNRVHEGLIELFTCDQCDFKTNLRGSLKRHISNNHINEAMQGRYADAEECDFEDCNFRTLFKSKLRSHIDIKHEGIVRFRCEFMNCAYGTNERKSLTEHTRTHTGQKIYKCHLCEKTFGRSRQKDTHVRNLHEGYKLFQCEYFGCTYETQYKFRFKAHTIKHTKSSPVRPVGSSVKAEECDHCDQTFTGKTARDKHIKTIHQNILRFKCEFLNCTYGTSIALYYISLISGLEI